MRCRPFVITLATIVGTIWATGVPARAAAPDDPTTSSSSSSTSTTAAAGETSLRWRVGFVNRGFSGDDPAAVSVYEDGLMIVADDDAPLGYFEGEIDDATMDHLVEAAAAVEPDADYGEVMVSDVGDTVVTIGGTTPVEIAVWGLHHDDGLPPEQQSARRALQRFVDDLVAAGDEVRDARQPYRPERVDVGLFAVSEDDLVRAEPWPLSEHPVDLRRPLTSEPWCFDAPVEDVPEPTDDWPVWSTPEMDAAAPTAVGAVVRAQLPGAEPCGGTPVEPAGRPLTAEEAASAAYDWASPWVEGTRRRPHPLEAWYVDEIMVGRVLPQQRSDERDWDSTRWSWFDVRVVRTEVDGRRYLDVHATCTDYVVDEEPACTIDARLDPATDELIEFAAT